MTCTRKCGRFLNGDQHFDPCDEWFEPTDFKELFESYILLLEEAMHLYRYYPNNFRKTAEEYFKREVELRNKLSEHFS